MDDTRSKPVAISDLFWGKKKVQEISPNATSRHYQFNFAVLKKLYLYI
jgi:hypothetical protein